MGSTPSKVSITAAASQDHPNKSTKPAPATNNFHRPDVNKDKDQVVLVKENIVKLFNIDTPWDENGQELLAYILQSFFKEDGKLVKEIGKLLAKHNFLDVYVRIWDHCQTTDVEEEKYSKSPAYKLIKIICWNYSDKSVDFCKAAYHHKTAVRRTMLEFTQPEMAVGELTNDIARYYLKASMGFLHNILRLYNANRTLVRENDGIQKVLKYHQSKYLIIKAKVMLILAYCINEQENDKIMTGAGVITFIVKSLTSAVTSPTHVAKVYSFSALETVMGLNKLAFNDSNKLSIVKAGILPYLCQMLGVDFSVDEQRAALECLWTLSFHPDNKPKVVEEPGLLDTVRSMAKDPQADKEIRRSCDGILFNIEGKTLVEQEQSAAPPLTKHIMISYQWDVQETILQLRSSLQQNGFTVWLDVDRMEGSILSAMADAVENSSVVLIAMTEKYKNSNPCRTESEYAYKLSKPIVPLLLEQHYKPDGWLGALLGMQLYIDISQQDGLTSKMQTLVQTIQHKTKLTTAAVENITVVDSQPLSAAPDRAPSRQIAVRSQSRPTMTSWTNKEVADWAANTGVAGLSELLSPFDGVALHELGKLLRRCPNVFYTSVRADLAMNLQQTLHLAHALESLPPA